MTGILVSIALASFVAVQAAAAGASYRIVIPVAAGMAGVMAAFWALAIGTLFPSPDMWDRVPWEMGKNFVLAAVGGALFTGGSARLMGKIAAFRKKYPER